MELKEIIRRMHNTELYFAPDENLMAEQQKCMERLYDFNQTRPSEQDKRQAMLKEMFASFGENCYIEPPLRTNWGGKHVHFGKGVYANFNLTLVDDSYIYIGDHTMFGPNVTLATAGHPLEPELRKTLVQFNASIHIGKNVWLGAGVVVMPGITIGDNAVIGAGSVVTKDIPANVIAVGNPCKVLRLIDERDKKYYYKDLEI